MRHRFLRALAAVGIVFEASRPFTLLPPALGILSGSVCALFLRAEADQGPDPGLFLRMTLTVLMAAVLNAASNLWNQVHDLAIDRINKPGRPIPRGALSESAARKTAFALYACALLLAASVQPGPVPELLAIVSLTVFLTLGYSAEPFRWRRSYWLGPLVIAIPRGGLLKLSGFAAVAPVSDSADAYAIAGIFFVFVFGAAATKDFGDMEGDRADGCSSLPLRFGPKRAAQLMAPFYVLPWVLLALLPELESLWGGSAWRERPNLFPVAAWLILRGAMTGILLIRGADRLCRKDRARWEWINLYVLMMEAQVLVALASYAP